MNFSEALQHVLKHEGGYSNLESDPGGETNFGITVAVARENGYLGDMRTIPMSVVESIYKRKYWDKVRADEMPESVRFALFDYAVNSGPGAAIRALQRVLGVADDGVLGPMTLAAAQAQSAGLGARLNGYRLKFMTELKIWPTFSKGWARRIADNLMAEK